MVLGSHPGPNVRSYCTPVTLVLLWPKYPIETTRGLGWRFSLTLDFRGFCLLVWLGEDRTQHLSSWWWEHWWMKLVTSLWTRRQRMRHQQGLPLVTSLCQLASPPKKFLSLCKWRRQLGSKCLKYEPAETFCIQSLTCGEW